MSIPKGGVGIGQREGVKTPTARSSRRKASVLRWTNTHKKRKGGNSPASTAAPRRGGRERTTRPPAGRGDRKQFTTKKIKQKKKNPKKNTLVEARTQGDSSLKPKRKRKSLLSHAQRERRRERRFVPRPGAREGKSVPTPKTSARKKIKKRERESELFYLSTEEKKRKRSASFRLGVFHDGRRSTFPPTEGRGNALAPTRPWLVPHQGSCIPA